MASQQVIQGDCANVLKKQPPDTIDCLITDPPYGYSFMGKSWDKAVVPVETWRECLRVLKPGAFAFVMSAPRQDVLGKMIANLTEAGFKTDFTSIYWAYASGFPKAMNVGKAVDKRLGAEREVVGSKLGQPGYSLAESKGQLYEGSFGGSGNPIRESEITAPATTQAKALDGSYGGFQPKPAVEIILVAMKPLSEKTYVDQALANGKGVTWLESARIPAEASLAKNWERNQSQSAKEGRNSMNGGLDTIDLRSYTPTGRFPANLIVSDDVLNDGVVRKSGKPSGVRHASNHNVAYADMAEGSKLTGFGDSGTFSRYFSLDAWWESKLKELPDSVQRTFPFLLTPKASKREKGADCKHPTVKPLALMSYLITLGSRPGDTVLDPFMGSGTTLLAAKNLNRNAIGIEKDENYCEIARQRLKNVV